MPVDVKVTANGNDVTNKDVKASAGQKVTFAAVEPGTDPPKPVDGSWKRDTADLRASDKGKIEVTAGPATAGKYVFTSAATTAEMVEMSLEVTGEEKQTFWGRFFKSTGAVVLVLAGYTGLTVYVMYGPLPWDETDAHRSSLVGALTIVAMFVLAHVAGHVASGESGILNLVAGTDMRASTSKIQALMWTLLLGFVLAFVASYAALSSGTFECSATTTTFCIPSQDDVWTPYLVLLGVPAAAAAIAKGVVTSKVSNGTLQKTEVEQTNLVQVATNDAGHADLVDIQYLMFNLIALVYVTAHFAADHTLPDVPDLLLGLTSAAAGTYVLNKSMLNNKPLITSVTPSAVKPGDVLTVKGDNLLVADSRGETPKMLTAKVAGISTVAERVALSTDTLSVRVPEGLLATTETSPVVKVTTKANIETDGYPISLLPIKVLGWIEAATAPKSGEKVRLAVTGLPKHGELAPDDRKTVQVVVDGNTARGEITADDEVSFQVPLAVKAGASGVKVSFQGRTSEVEKVPTSS